MYYAKYNVYFRFMMAINGNEAQIKIDASDVISNLED
jgi:hypothetical protein